MKWRTDVKRTARSSDMVTAAELPVVGTIATDSKAVAVPEKRTKAQKAVQSLDTPARDCKHTWLPGDRNKYLWCKHCGEKKPHE
jgi:hypothetical protein